MRTDLEVRRSPLESVCAGQCLCSECPECLSCSYSEAESDETRAFGVQLSSRTRRTRGPWLADVLGGPQAAALGDVPGGLGELRDAWKIPVWVSERTQ